MHGIFIMSSVYFILFISSSQNTSVNLQVLFLTCLSSHSINLILWRDVVKKGEINKESKLSSGFPWSVPLREKSEVGGDSESQYFTHLGLTGFDRLQKETCRDGYRWWKKSLCLIRCKPHRDRNTGLLFSDKHSTIYLTPPTCGLLTEE